MRVISLLAAATLASLAFSFTFVAPSFAVDPTSDQTALECERMANQPNKSVVDQRIFDAHCPALEPEVVTMEGLWADDQGQAIELTLRDPTKVTAGIHAAFLRKGIVYTDAQFWGDQYTVDFLTLHASLGVEHFLTDSLGVWAEGEIFGSPIKAKVNFNDTSKAEKHARIFGLRGKLGAIIKLDNNKLTLKPGITMTRVGMTFEGNGRQTWGDQLMVGGELGLAYALNKNTSLEGAVGAERSVWDHASKRDGYAYNAWGRVGLDRTF